METLISQSNTEGSLHPAIKKNNSENCFTLGPSYMYLFSHAQNFMVYTLIDHIHCTDSVTYKNILLYKQYLK